MRIYVTEGENKRCLVVNMGENMVRKYDNGSLISTGLWVTSNDITQKKFDEWYQKAEKNVRGFEIVSYEKFNHSGYQSSCILRGDKKCQW